MSPNVPMTPAAAASFPRVSGDEPTTMHAYSRPRAFSPRERG